MNNFDVGIIGGGPAGYTLAIKLAQYGKRVVIFEKKFIGGTCLNVGCIPTKAILHSCSLYDNFKKSEKFGIFAQNITADFQKIYERKNSVVEKMQKSLQKMIESYEIAIIEKEAEIISKNEIKCENEIYDCEKIVAATGAEPVELGSLKFGDNVLNSNDILDLEELPKSLLIIGSGAIGTEWARIFSTLGVEVSVVEMAEKLLPIADFEVSQRLERILKRNKVKIYLSDSVEKFENGIAILKSGVKIPAQKILCAVGRKPVFPKSNLDFECDEKGRAIVDEKYLNKNEIFVIGDASSTVQLAHNAIHQGIYLANYLCKNEIPKTYEIPSIIYGHPEIAWIGKTEQELKDLDYKKSFYSVSSLGKAQADGEIDGFVKLLSVNNIIVGAHIISPEASSLICEFILPVQNKINIKDLGHLCHPHPTYSEASFEAILGLSGFQINVMKGQN